MQIKEFLNSVCERIKYKPIRESISEELENHIEEAKENYMQEGLKEKAAEEKAINQMGDAEEIGKRLNKIHRPRLDWKLLLILVILLGFGLLVAFTRANNVLFGDFIAENSIKKYIFFLIIGTIASISIYFIDYTKIIKYSNIFYIAATITIIYALTFGVSVNGLPYIYISPSITFSPVVIAVPLYIISFVGFINNLKQESKLKIKIQNRNINVNVVKTIVLSIISLFLLTLIPSITSAFILGLTYLIIGTVKIFEIKENRKRNILMLWGIPAIIGTILLIHIVGLYPYRWNRFVVAFNPESDPEGGGWVAMNRKTIIESAQVFGEAGDTSNALSLFDEGTNFAFISILAHYGWIVSIGIVIAVIALSSKLIINAIKIKDMNGKLLIVGLSSMFILQSIFNILMNLNLWIEANFNLPFVSYGGGNLIINMMCLALILAIYRRKDIIIKEKNNNSAKVADNN